MFDISKVSNPMLRGCKSLKDSLKDSFSKASFRFPVFVMNYRSTTHDEGGTATLCALTTNFFKSAVSTSWTPEPYKSLTVEVPSETAARMQTGDVYLAVRAPVVFDEFAKFISPAKPIIKLASQRNNW